MKEVPVNLVISFLKVHFKNHTTLFFPFYFMNNFMKRDHPIHDISTFDKTILKITDHRSDAACQSISQDFGNNLVKTLSKQIGLKALMSTALGILGMRVTVPKLSLSMLREPSWKDLKRLNKSLLIVS
jgi:hypothetical protein